ncbi:hypothetical protein V1506DRAFT_555652 [Lipomyces tetrasporus]
MQAAYAATVDSRRIRDPVNCDVDFDPSNLKGKTAIVTGGANGIGEAYVRAQVAAGVTVCIGDCDVAGGKKLAAELHGRTKFIECDTAKWDDQIAYVVANAGVIRQDDVFSYSGENQEPEKPDLSTIDININGTLYTVKLSLHYFVKQNGQETSSIQEDTCLVLIGSGAAFLDCPRIPQYSATKWAMRGIMHSLRRTAFYYGSRVNVISPWYVKTKIMSEEAFAHVVAMGVQLAEAEDAGQCLLRILSDATINGHSFFIAARKWASRGYVDLDLDDYRGNALIQEVQEDQMKSAPASMGLFV